LTVIKPWLPAGHSSWTIQTMFGLAIGAIGSLTGGSGAGWTTENPALPSVGILLHW
jgi:hypothetical protein